MSAVLLTHQQIEEIKIKDETVAPNDSEADEGKAGAGGSKIRKGLRRRESIDRSSSSGKGTPRRGSVDGFTPPMLGQERFDVRAQNSDFPVGDVPCYVRWPSTLPTFFAGLPLQVAAVASHAVSPTGCAARGWYGDGEIGAAKGGCCSDWDGLDCF